ncbi:MAG: hypothetical protein BWY21_00340 [Parcubacteria group bacterium ADurb.Bin216]|nr:MAG: hypothetical protein BWY21_00340 [Parcubacteria group bacterium ADurb.Bin216]
MSEEITTLKTCLLQMQNANIDLVKQLDDCRRECAELKARLWEGPQNVKPEMWIAWHPVEGFAPTTASRLRSFCEDRLLKGYFNFDSGSEVFTKADAYYAARDIELIRASNANWRIRPVKLVFLDDPKPQGEE